MTSPIETNNVVERDDAICARCGCYRSAHGEDERCEPVGWSFTTEAEAADLIQSLSDRINVLEGALQLVRRIAKPLIEVDDVWEDSTHIVTAIDNALTQGGKNV